LKTFSKEIEDLQIEELLNRSDATSSKEVECLLNTGKINSLTDFAKLLSPVASQHLEQLAERSQQTTRRHFGKVIRLFAPLYLSNECVNICKYCGFSRNNPIPRITLPLEKVRKETRLLAEQGFRSILLVAGEHPKHVSGSYVEDCIEACLELMPSVLLEIAPMETEDYIPLVKAGSEGLVVYQETYHPETYRELHPHGPKKNYSWRLDAPQRGYSAGFRRLGIGALFGLYNWRYEAICLAAHALHLSRYCCNAQLSISFPRMRPAAGEYQPEKAHLLPDRQLVQLLCGLRLLLPHVAFVLSTRESPALRDGLIPLGITNISAGSSTEPGAYSDYDTIEWKPKRQQPGEQFQIADERSPAQIANLLRQKDLEPVWKDFDTSLVTAFSPQIHPSHSENTSTLSQNSVLSY
jgi:2-iminoacetate synthase